MKNILVLGGSGFIGREIVRKLLIGSDCKITVADIKSHEVLEEIINDEKFSKRLRIHLADYSKKEAFKDLTESFDEVYMLAAIVGVNNTIQNPEKVIDINTRLTLNTIDWASKNPIKKLLFSSSSENYAGSSDLGIAEIPTNEDVPLTISDILHPRWTYALTKMHGESAFIHSSRVDGYDCTIVRYQNIIGPRMGFNHAIPHIVERFINNHDPFLVYGHSQTRAFCYIDDAVKGTIAAMESQSSNEQIYHIGNSQEITIDELTRYIGSIIGFKGEYKNAPTYPGSVNRRCPDISKAELDLGYAPEFSWQDAVQKTVEWYIDFFKSGNLPPTGGFKPPEVVLPKEE